MDPEHPPLGISVPTKFSALISVPSWREQFQNMLGEMPPEFMKYGVIQPGEYPGLVMGGDVYYVVKRGGRALYIYRFVGLPEGLPARRPEGTLDVIVDPQQREMAGIWNGPHDLSQYRFLGSAAVLPQLIAYEIASEAETEKIHKVSLTERPASVVLPVPVDRKDYTQGRFDYLASIVTNGEINDARSEFYAGDQLRRKSTEPERIWYAIDVSRTGCIKSISPATRIKMIRDEGFKEVTKDTADALGTLVKVEVSHQNGLYVLTNTYYSTKEACMTDLTNAKTVPDKYH